MAELKMLRCSVGGTEMDGIRMSTEEKMELPGGKVRGHSEGGLEDGWKQGRG